MQSRLLEASTLVDNAARMAAYLGFPNNNAMYHWVDSAGMFLHPFSHSRPAPCEAGLRTAGEVTQPACSPQKGPRPLHHCSMATVLTVLAAAGPLQPIIALYEKQNQLKGNKANNRLPILTKI